MPLYEYQCAECGRFEVIQKFSDALLTVCPKCGKEVHKLPSAPAIQFKGTGWYITDYARKSSGGDKDGASKDGSSKESASKESGSKESGSKEPSSSDSSSMSTTSKDSPASGSGSSKS